MRERVVAADLLRPCRALTRVLAGPRGAAGAGALDRRAGHAPARWARQDASQGRLVDACPPAGGATVCPAAWSVATSRRAADVTRRGQPSGERRVVGAPMRGAVPTRRFCRRGPTPQPQGPPGPPPGLYR